MIPLNIQTHSLSLDKNPIFTNPIHSSINPFKNSVKIPTSILASSSSASTVFQQKISQDDASSSPQKKKKKLCVVVKPMEKPRLVLKFIWMEKNIGIALDQVIPGQGTIPLSPYYFWPRKDAWEELKVMLESKPWISHGQMVNLLNQATEIINLWQEGGGDIV
ncbi:ribosomal protein [Lithospermum erythrorhizon]|uniref:30S ribosomal protein 3, chloroplastic n=1 Tax=Lithospermum erythrorhizon TaxID=34254 RepID=A0AAV3QQE5_LITER